ncbi:phage tail protein I [Caulobacter segnis]|uniref:Phage tail protein I n=1 Tax=Caulobacter segnis TaxID=88688 RepID=A0A2W5WSP6_9CAUL|nr:phage tail protein I [Caulobacter segnis]PZR37178.1 MAG: phage tail protein I [Caulobacter segnis]
MADVESLLANATPWMRAVEAASAPAWSLPVHLIPDFHDPWRCAPHLLSDLAFDCSVDVWSETWSETKKRAVIARSVEMHRQKGTRAGLRAYIEVAGGELRRITAPGQGLFAEAASADDRAAWIARFPEFRLFTHTPWSEDPDDAYTGEACAGDELGAFAPDAPATRLLTRDGVLFRDGVEIRMTRREDLVLVDGVETIVERYVAVDEDPRGAYGDMAWADDFPIASDPLPALTVTLDTTAGQTIGRSVSSQFLDTAPERVRAVGADAGGAYGLSDYFDAVFAEPGMDPAVLVFDRWRLADPARAAGGSMPGDTFLDDPALVGDAAFTLLLDVVVPDALAEATAIVGGFDLEFCEPHDSSQTDLVLEAIQSAAADRDTVLVRFAAHRPARLGDRPTLPFRLGQLVADF